ncbi:alpha/beta hydrolase [Streptomyces sp. Act143]|uniref:alpha/beta hydrolase n=1 Tax=Streptomyces sp. Act143 TaxID=2200760 RepID=UPI000D67D761|nr:alpha/beta fold hydrolase [Streptomyces sp. Act143]PWI15270.1 alpha/beta hydrolase [Streptomyces sp. Act143]
MNRTPVVFIHGAWLHALSWESWAERFASRGFLAFTPGWPGEPLTVGEMRRSSEGLTDVGLDLLTDHYAKIVDSFDIAPVIIGHSVGGLIAQHLIGANIGQAAVAIAPAPVNDIVLPAPPTGLWIPGHADGDAPPASGTLAFDPLVSLSAEQFHRFVANTVTEEESARLYDRYVVPMPRRLLADLGCADSPRSPRAVADVGNADRGPLLLISGQEDLLVPDAATRAAYKQYGDSMAVTDLKQFADRAHSLIIDNGWRFVADYVLGWLDEHGLRAHSL